MAVQVSSGVITVSGTQTAVIAVTSLPIAPASTTDRKDIVIVNSAGVVSAITGTPGVSVVWSRNTGTQPPVKAPIPANSVLLAEIYVAANSTSISINNIVDKRVIEQQVILKANNLADVVDTGSSRYNLHVGIETGVKAVSVSNVAALTGLPVVDGYQTLNSDVILLTAQTTASQNGLWQMAASGSGAWVRPTQFPAGGTIGSARKVVVSGGTKYAGTDWVLQTTTTITIDTTAQTWVNTVPPLGTFVHTTGEALAADGAWLSGFQDLSDRAQAPPVLPFFSADLTRYAGNPVISAASIPGGTGGTNSTVADPYLLEVNGVLYILVEFITAGGSNGQIWRGQSTDAGQTWSGWVKVSHDDTMHFHDPSMFVHLGEVHVMYEHADAGNTLGQIWHRSTSVADWETAGPTLSAAFLMLDSSVVGIPHRFTEFAIFQYKGIWYCLVVTGTDSTHEDRQLFGWWSSTFILDWNNYGQPMTNPVLDTANSSWLQKLTHLTIVQIGGDAFILAGIDPNNAGYKGIGAFSITRIDPREGLRGVWLEKTQVWGLAASGWDGPTASIHRAHVVLHSTGTWVLAYDSTPTGSVDWQIGIATMSARGASRSTYPTTAGEVVHPPSFYAADMSVGAPPNWPATWAPVGVKVTSYWGLDANGNPYFNAAGVTAGDEAVLSLDNGSGWPALTKVVG